MPAFRRFALNIAQKRLGGGLCPGPLGRIQHSPDSLVAELREKGGDGRKREGMDGES